MISHSLERVEIPLITEIRKHQCLWNHNLPEYNRKDTSEEAWNEISANLNMPTSECKEKWKNLRSSYVRSLRPFNGGKLRKPYYLGEHMQFVLPYLKMGVDAEEISQVQLSNTSHSQLTSPQTQQKIDLDNTEEDEDEDNNIKLEQADSHNDESDSEIVAEIEDDPLISESEEVEIPKVKTSTPRRKRWKLVNLRNNVNGRTQMNGRINNKRQKITNNMKPERPENNATKYFLLSLLPELESMDEEQVRQFKIKVMMLIDEIKNNTQRIKNMSSLTENERLQKKLINLLVKSLDKNDTT